MMKMKNLATLVAVTLFSLLAVSCQPKDDNQPEEATLTLSTQSLVMDNKAQTAPEITFETNQPKVVVSARADWLDATVQGSSIIIKAEANTLGKERKSEVLVLAGSAIDKITVTQSSADIVLEVSPEEKTVTNVGEEFYVSIKSNSNAWVVEPSAFDWIKVEKFTDDILKVIVLPNKDKEAREGQLFAKLGNVTKQITITQVGVGAEKFMLPLLERQPTQYEIINYETKQGNYLVSYSGPLPSWGIYDESYTFACASEIFEKVIYNGDVQKAAITDILMIANNDDALKSEEFKTFLKDNGFTIGEVKQNGSFVAEHAEASYEVFVNISEDPNQYSHLKFVPVVNQPKELPTFASFPYDKSDILNDAAWTSGKIVEAEEAAGSTVTVSNNKKYPDFVDMIMAVLKKGADRFAPHTRAYFIDTDEEEGTSTDLAEELIVAWDDFEVGVWFDGSAYILTNEFKKLLKDEGFEFMMERNGLPFYYNATKKMMIVPYGRIYSDINDGKPCFFINYFDYDADASSMHDPILQNMIAKELGARLDAQEALLNK